jgi:FkbM family methyltransferase
MPEGTQLVFEHYLGDIQVNIDTRFKVERIMWTGAYEPELMDFCRSYIPEGATCLDVGGNVGAVTLALAKAVGDSGRVHTFEPAPQNLRRLEANLALNPVLASRVTLHRCGCGNQPGVLYWQEESGNPGNGFLGVVGSEKVDVVVLDAHFEDQPLTRLDFIKVDVEGMELEVFQGARELLREDRPILFFETLSRFRNAGKRDNFGELRSFLKKLGYKFYRHKIGDQWTPVGDGRWGDSTVAVHRDGSL